MIKAILYLITGFICIIGIFIETIYFDQNPPQGFVNNLLIGLSCGLLFIFGILLLAIGSVKFGEEFVKRKQLKVN